MKEFPLIWSGNFEDGGNFGDLILQIDSLLNATVLLILRTIDVFKLVDLNFHINSSGKLFLGTTNTASIAFQGVVLKLRSTRMEMFCICLAEYASCIKRMRSKNKLYKWCLHHVPVHQDELVTSSSLTYGKQFIREF